MEGAHVERWDYRGIQAVLCSVPWPSHPGPGVTSSAAGSRRGPSASMPPPAASCVVRLPYRRDVCQAEQMSIRMPLLAVTLAGTPFQSRHSRW